MPCCVLAQPPLRSPIPHKRYIVELSPAERTRLRSLTATGSPTTKARRRAQIWLFCDQGPEGPAWTDARTAEAVGVTEMTVM